MVHYTTAITLPPHLPPPPTVYIQNPGISQDIVSIVQPSSDQELWVLLAIIQTATSMVTSLLWPRFSFGLAEFGPVLQIAADNYQHTT